MSGNQGLDIFSVDVGFFLRIFGENPNFDNGYACEGLATFAGYDSYGFEIKII